MEGGEEGENDVKFDPKAWNFGGTVDLDPRIICSLGDLNFSIPTDVQAQSIPLMYTGKDVYMQCRTGSGKTAAYIIPILDKIIKKNAPGIHSLILVPTKELGWQVTECAERLAKYSDVKVVDLCKFPETRRNELNEGKYSIVVSTPTKALNYIKKQKTSSDLNLETLVLDEADLILSYGYESDTREILSLLSKGYQTCLASATLNADLSTVIGIPLKNLSIVRLSSAPENAKVRHYYVLCSKYDRYLYLFYVLKFKLNPFGSKKTLIFVNSVDEAYKLKLFLELFKIKCVSLNPNLPIESRIHIIQEFNKGVYDHIIAVDIHHSTTSFKPSEVSTIPKTTLKKIKNDLNFGASRGIDFMRVDCIINLDFPLDVSSYIHRAGRTGRGMSRSGAVLSFFVSPHKINSPDFNNELKNTILHKVIESCKSRNITPNPFSFNSGDVEPFRYRVENVLRAVNTRAIKFSKISEIKNEIINSSKLKNIIQSDQQLRCTLRHDLSVAKVKIESNITNIPSYLIPKSLSTATNNLNKPTPPPLISADCPKSITHTKNLRHSNKHPHKRRSRQKSNPLKSFKI